MSRNQLTYEEKQKIIYLLVCNQELSQGTIAKRFDVDRATINKLWSAYKKEKENV